MKYLLRLFLSLLAVFAIAGCREGEKTKADSAFSVNLKSEDSSLDIPDEGSSVRVYVSSDSPWSHRFSGGEAPSWLEISEPEKLNSNSWYVLLTAPENAGDAAREADIVFSNASHSYTLHVVQPAIDPLLKLLRPGFYGLEGGDVLLGGRLQGSRSISSGSISYSLMDPFSLKTWTVRFPADAASQPKGSEVGGVWLSIREKDRTLSNTALEEVVLLRKRDNTLWLKTGDGKGLVVRMP
ncbi:MAG: BACON domain-containing protein [Bacteroidales bacterium]|nr:BACON domain-containing protein [Bacteroidales bacterium]